MEQLTQPFFQMQDFRANDFISEKRAPYQVLCRLSWKNVGQWVTWRNSDSYPKKAILFAYASFAKSYEPLPPIVGSSSKLEC
jgi:hypothetical protein